MGFGIGLGISPTLGQSVGVSRYNLASLKVDRTASGEVSPRGATLVSMNILAGSNLTVALYDSAFSDTNPQSGAEQQIYSQSGLGVGPVALNLEPVSGVYMDMTGTGTVEFVFGPSP